jgi:hypothetical protein
MGTALAVLTPGVLGAAEDWVELFDGQTLDGWVQRGGDAKYAVEEGVIMGTTMPKTPNSFLCTGRDYGDFILELEFKVDDGLNSGVQIRSNAYEEGDERLTFGTAKIAAGRVHGYQVEIDPSDRAYTGGIYDEGRRGWLDDHGDNDEARLAFRPGEWNAFRVQAIGESIKTWLNGVPAADLKDGLTLEGFIALQVHGIGSKEGEFRVHDRTNSLQNPKLGD